MKSYNPKIQDQNQIIGQDAPSAGKTFILLNVKDKEERDKLLGLFVKDDKERDKIIKYDQGENICTYAILSKQLPEVKKIFPNIKSCTFLMNDWNGTTPLDSNNIDDIKKQTEEIDKEREKKSEGRSYPLSKIGSLSKKDEESLNKGAKYVEYRRLYDGFKLAAMYILPPGIDLPIAKKSLYNLPPKK